LIGYEAIISTISIVCARMEYFIGAQKPIAINIVCIMINPSLACDLSGR
jgi:hypothetical protein